MGSKKPKQIGSYMGIGIQNISRKLLGKEGKKNRIIQIKDEKGILTENPEEIENIFLTHSKEVIVATPI